MGNSNIDTTTFFNEMVKALPQNMDSISDVVSLDNSLDRNLYVDDIERGIGASIESMIRFWNRKDEREKVPVEKREPIKLYIDSFGGSLVDGFTIIDAIKASKTPVWTIATGCAYSAGFFIFICGDKRIAFPRASFLYHEGSASTGGTANQFRNFADFYNKQLEQLSEIVLENTSFTKEEYEAMKKDDVWMTAEEAFEKGCVDEIARDLV